jgi:hypothetical protein
MMIERFFSAFSENRGKKKRVVFLSFKSSNGKQYHKFTDETYKN